MGDAKLAENCECGVPRHELVTSPANDLGFSGPFMVLTAGENVVFGDVCYLESDGKMWKADADAEATADGLILMAMGSISADAEGIFLKEGIVRKDAWDWTAKSKLYISTTPGNPTETAPSELGDIARVIGYAMHSDRLYFIPSSTYEEISA